MVELKALGDGPATLDSSAAASAAGTSVPNLRRHGVTTSWNRHAFDYGSGESAVELTVSVPVRRCDACGFACLDEAAERLKHEAVWRHLGVLAPAETTPRGGPDPD